MYIVIFEMPFAAMIVAGLMPVVSIKKFGHVLSYGTHLNYLCAQIIFAEKILIKLYLLL